MSEGLEEPTNEPMSVSLRIAIAQQLGDIADALRNEKDPMVWAQIRNQLIVAEVDEDSDETKKAYATAIELMSDNGFIDRDTLKQLIADRRLLYP